MMLPAKIKIKRKFIAFHVLFPYVFFMGEVEKSDFAMMAGVTVPAINYMIKAGRIKLTENGRIDTEDARSIAYVNCKKKKHQAQRIAASGPLIKSFSELTDKEISDYTNLPQHILSMSIRDLVKWYKGIEGVERYAKLLRDLTFADEKEQKVRERRLQLVEKDFMVAHVFQYLDVLMTQLLELPAAVSDEVVALVQAKGAGARMEVQTKITGGITRIIKGAKEHILSEISSLRPKYGEKDQESDRVAERLEAIEEAIGA